jgi:hypothetical protein
MYLRTTNHPSGSCIAEVSIPSNIRTTGDILAVQANTGATVSLSIHCECVKPNLGVELYHRERRRLQLGQLESSE